MKNIFIKILAVMLIIIFILQYSFVMATNSKSELQGQQSEIDQQIKEKEEKLEGIKTEKSEILQQVENLISQISEYESDIDDLDDQIEELNGKIKDSEEELQKEQKEYDENQQALNERLVAVYENGETSYLDFLLSSEGLTDFISNYFLVSELATYDTDLLESIEKKKNQIEEQKKKLEESKTELNNTKTSKEAKQKKLSTAKTEKSKYAAKLSEDEKSTQAELEQFEKDKQEITAKLKKIAEQEEAARRQQGNSGTTIISGNPSASGYIFPVSGLSKANIRNKSYPSYKGHTGVDVNIGVTGKSVVAVKSGTVVISQALKNSSGGYRSYGEYVVISHGDGTMTFYAHMLANSRRVQVGSHVSQGQVIGIVGSTGNSTGTHLHFEVRVGGRPVNPLPYLP